MAKTITKDVLIEDSTDGLERDETSTIRSLHWTICWTQFVVSVFEIVCGLTGYSPLLIIDGLTSAAIAVVATTALLGIEMSKDSSINGRYRYGQGKMEFLAALIVGIFLGISGLTYWVTSIKRIRYPTIIDDVFIGMSISIIAIMTIATLITMISKVRVPLKKMQFTNIQKLQVLSLFSSIMVFLSFFSAYFGWVAADRLSRFVVSFVVTTMSFFIMKDALEGLMDRSGGVDIEEQINSIIKRIEKVKKINWIKSRRVGRKIYADIQIEMEKDKTISDFDTVTKTIKENFSKEFGEMIYINNIEYSLSD